jgi:hypothetical protein
METATLYYTHRRTGKWAHLIVYAVHHGQLDKIGRGKYQPGATAGVHREVEEYRQRRRVDPFAVRGGGGA